MDVRQYGMQNAGFPQQSTADFWYDEAQFESYRRLGEHCAGFILDKMNLKQTGGGDPASSHTI
ncbi:MAG: hypothetical protein LC800_20880 [Acidobacteria bacterium]|nr:hypothetical protein [Acidobacteriota bacterium]